MFIAGSLVQQLIGFLLQIRVYFAALVNPTMFYLSEAIAARKKLVFN